MERPSPSPSTVAASAPGSGLVWSKLSPHVPREHDDHFT
jgi:hypothetical protein